MFGSVVKFFFNGKSQVNGPYFRALSERIQNMYDKWVFECQNCRKIGPRRCEKKIFAKISFFPIYDSFWVSHDP